MSGTAVKPDTVKPNILRCSGVRFSRTRQTQEIKRLLPALASVIFGIKAHTNPQSKERS